MEIRERFIAHPIAPSIFRAVGEHRAIRADRGGHQRLGLRRARARAELIAGGPRERDGLEHETGGAIAIDAALRESLERRLVGGGGRHLRAGFEVIEMDGADEIRLLDEIFGGPQRIGEICATALELGCERAVEDDDRPQAQERRERLRTARLRR